MLTRDLSAPPPWHILMGVVPCIVLHGDWLVSSPLLPVLRIVPCLSEGGAFLWRVVLSALSHHAWPTDRSW